MPAMTLPLLTERIASSSLAARQGLAIEVLAETASTNAELRARAAGLKAPLLLAAESQTAGRGRAGRSWRSAPGDSLCFSIAWHFRGPLNRLSGLSLAVGVAVAETLRAQGCPVQLKWPNDLLLDGAKLGGILVETAPSAAAPGLWAVIGTGLNVRANAERDAVPGERIASIDDGLTDRNPLLASLADALYAALDVFDREGLPPFIARWLALHAHQDCAVSLIEQGRLLHEGIARGIDDSGRLLIDTAAGPVAVTAGDVSLRGKAINLSSGHSHAAAG